jgi:hypothetical protein
MLLLLPACSLHHNCTTIALLVRRLKFSDVHAPAGDKNSDDTRGRTSVADSEVEGNENTTSDSLTAREQNGAETSTGVQEQRCTDYTGGQLTEEMKYRLRQYDSESALHTTRLKRVPPPYKAGSRQVAAFSPCMCFHHCS